MKRVLLSLLSVCFIAQAGAQAVATEPNTSASDPLQLPGDFTVKRQEIEAVRQRETARFDAADAQCKTRFAVTDCLSASQTKRRAVMSDLRRQESHLNELERARRGAEQLELSNKKALERAQREKDVAANHAANVEAQAQKQNEQAQKREANRKVPASPVGGSKPVPNAPSGPTPAEQSTHRADYERRQAEAQQRHIDAQKRQKDKAAKPASTLPVPP
jgi:hypothetical protein